MLNKTISLTLIAAMSLALVSCRKETMEPKASPVDLNQYAPSSTSFHSENSLSADFSSTIWSHYQTGVSGSFSSGVSIHYKSFAVSGEKGAVVLLPGRNEPAAKYAEVIYDLNNKNYSVYVMSHRGQGESGRMLTNPQIGYVQSFRDYVNDLSTFVGIVKSKTSSKLFMLAHSMGGAIGAQYLHDHPNDFTAAVLSAPMLGINTGVWPEAVTYNMIQTAVNTGQDKGYVPGHKDFDPNLKFEDTVNTDVTRSRPRFDMKMKIFLDNPTWQLGGVSYRWLHQSYMMTKEVGSSFYAGETATRILMFQAGLDTIVKNSPQTSFCSKAPRCQLETFSDSYHEILQERDSIRNSAMSKVVGYFEHFVQGGQ